jgi:hypothetical protein
MKFLLSLFLVGTLAGCSTVGTGHRTIVRARCEAEVRPAATDGKEPIDPCVFLTTRYPQYIAPSGTKDEERLVHVGPEEQPGSEKKVPTYADFTNFLKLRYGDSSFQAADLSFNHHDRTSTPAFQRADARSSLVTTLGALFTADSKLTQQQRISTQRLLEARLLNVPDLAHITAPHGTAGCGKGCRDDFKDCIDCCAREGRSDCQEACSSPKAILYYYYPRVSVDFSSSLRTLAPVDRLSHLGLVVRIQDREGGIRDGVRFLDFFPKDADLVEFSRGDFNQSIALQGGANLGATTSGTLTRGEAPLVSVAGTGSSQGLSSTVTLSEGLSSKLADAIERRSTGILENGSIFFADFRSIRQVRIAGTYNFDLMLEIPSRLRRMGDVAVSEPVRDELIADVFLIGVVRHVYDRGHMGILYRVPESENDDLYEEVILDYLPNQLLWTAPEEPWFDPLTFQASQCKLRILTNREEAVFVVTDEVSGEIVANGTGKDVELAFPVSSVISSVSNELKPETCSKPPAPSCRKVQVRFLPITVSNGHGPAQVLRAMDRRGLVLTPDSLTTVAGTYEPSPTSSSTSTR